MKLFPPLYRRQLASYLHWPGTYITAAIFLAVSGLSFCGGLLRSLSERVELGHLIFGSYFFNLAFLALAAFLTMGLFAEDWRSGSLETLLSAPVTDIQVVAAKYMGALFLYTILCLSAVAVDTAILAFSLGPAWLDPAPIALGCLMLVLLGALYIAFGLLVSSLSKSAAAAGFVSFATLMAVFFIKDFLRLSSAGCGDWLDYVSGRQALLDFSRGLFDTRPVALCLAGVFFFFFATVKVVAARRWK